MMRDPNRIDNFLKIFSTYWKKVPDWRFTQFVSNMLGGFDGFYVEEDEFINLMERYFNGNC